MLQEVILPSVAAFIGTAGFAVMFNTPRRELLYCGFCGMLGWFVFALFRLYWQQPVVGTVVATAAVTAAARFLSYHRQMPSTL